MASPDRFKQSIVAIVAKRAANRCANPDCGAVTSGPSEDPSKAVNVGIAAHIYGANPGSARYDPNMESMDRSDVTNAIWLCGNCHKLIDDDPIKYPAGLLFEWQREHAQAVASQVGKAGANARKRFEERHLEEFGRLSYLAQRIILEKDDHWHYRLTAEVLRFETAPIIRRWRALERGLYAKRCLGLSREEFMPWFQVRLLEISQITEALSAIVDEEFQRAWAPPGIPADDIAIVEACRLFAEVLSRALEWEEAVRFVRVDPIHEELRDLYIGNAGNMINEAAKVPEYLQSMFASGVPESGKYTHTVHISLPDGWSDKMTAAFQRAIDAEASEN